MSHPGVTCDGCNDSNFPGIRYKCHVCENYDLCGNCVAQGVISKSHRDDHPLRQILPPPLDEGEFGGYNRRGRPSELFYEYTRAELFACPYCGADGMIEEALVQHVLSIHADEERSMVCPICASRPGGDPTYVSSDFLSHLDLRHRGGGASGSRGRRGGLSVRGRRLRLRELDSDVASFIDTNNRGGYRGGGGYFFGESGSGDPSGSSSLLRHAHRHEERKRSHKSAASKSKATLNAQLNPKRNATQVPLSEAERKERDISRMMKSVFLQELITSTLLETTTSSSPAQPQAQAATTPTITSTATA